MNNAFCITFMLPSSFAFIVFATQFLHLYILILHAGLTYSFQLTTYVKFLVRMLAQLDAQMNSVERIKHYVDHIEHEGKDMEHKEIPLSKMDPQWPARG